MNDCVLITGGTGKLGSILVRHFVEVGHHVVFTSRSRSRNDELVASLGERARFAIGLEVDLTAADNAKEFPRLLLENKRSVRWLVNNARALEHLRVDENGIAARNDFVAELELDVVVPYELTVSIAQDEGHCLRSVVNIGSQYGVVAPNAALYEDRYLSSPIQYGVAKAALSHLTKELAVRLAPNGARVNCVAFGGIEGRADQEFVRRYSVLSPSGRMLLANEVAGPVEFLLGDSSNAINGQTVVADGGWTLW